MRLRAGRSAQTARCRAKRADAGAGRGTAGAVRPQRSHAREAADLVPAAIPCIPDAVQRRAVCGQRRFVVHRRDFCRAGRSLVQDDHRPERDGAAQHAAAFLAGIPLQQGGGRIEGDGELHHGRAARRNGAAAGDADFHAGAGRHRLSVGRRHDPGRRAAADRERPFRQPSHADRRIHSGRKISGRRRQSKSGRPRRNAPWNRKPPASWVRTW